ncbi:ABC transporter substrate-binding protein [soil metagenome]
MQLKRPGILGTRTYPRRSVLGAGAALTAGGVLASQPRFLSGALAQDATPGAAPAMAASQVLRVQTGSSGASTFSFFPLGGGGDQQNWQSLLFTAPLYFDVDLNLKPGIFSSWTSDETFLNWTFTIDPAAKFSDGSPVTAADVKGTWEIMGDPLTLNGRVGGYLGNVVGFSDILNAVTTEASGLVAQDDATLVVTLATSDPIFNWRIATVHLCPVKAEQAKGKIDTFWQPGNDAVFSGPYMLDTFDVDQGTATMIPNPNWWKDEGPYLERLEYRFVTDPATFSVMVQNSEFDCGMQALPPELEGDFPGWFTPIKAFGFNSFWFAFTNPPTDDANVRKALVLSVNFEDVFKAAFPNGGGVPATQLLDPDLPCIDPTNTWYPYDVEGAKAALAASSYGSAENLPKLRVTPRGSNPVLQRALESIVEFWRQNLGITTIEFNAQPQEFGQDETSINVSRDDVVIRVPDSATFMQTAATTSSLFASGEMMKGYSNPQLDELVNQAVQLSPEDPQRCELALEAQKLFMDDYMVMFLGIENSVLCAQSYVANYLKGPDVTLIEPWKIYLAEY